MEARIAVAKIKKYATSDSGDTVEVVERPQGGLSVVLADGQSSGRGAKWISAMVVRKVISLLAEGVRDGAAARAASDFLFTERNGKVSATLNIISIDKPTNTIVITRNNPAPVILLSGNQIDFLNDECQSIGLYRGTRPSIIEIQLKPGLSVIVFSDGLIHAGSRYGESIDLHRSMDEFIDKKEASAQLIADTLLESALLLDKNRPVDDVSVVVVQIISESSDNIRRMTVQLPLDINH